LSASMVTAAAVSADLASRRARLAARPPMAVMP